MSDDWHFAKYVEHSADIIDDFVDCDDPDISLPYTWSAFSDSDGNGGPAVKDPLMLYVSIPGMGVWDDENAPVWCQPFGAIVDNVVEGHMVVTGPLAGTIPPNELKVITDIRDALAAIVDKLSVTIAKSAQP
jgi:hypothetical protein